MTFLIVLLALVLLEAYSDLGSVQPDQWLRKWHQALSQALFLERSSTFKVAGFVLLPLITVSLALLSLQHYGLGFFSLIAELLVLLYSLGRGNIDTQITLLDSDLGSEDLRKALNDAAVFDTIYREDHSQSIKDVREAMLSALPYRLFERSFVVIFWFCLFGAPVALGYRLLALHGDMQLDQAADDNKNNETRMVAKLRWLVEWLPARLLGITLGLVGHFSQTFGQLRQMIFCSKTSASDLLHRCVAPSTGGLVGSPLSNTEIVNVTGLFRRSMTAWLVIIAILVVIG